MKDRNICKFAQPLAVETLSVSCFVLESDPGTMEREVQLGSHQMILVSQGSGEFRFDDVPVTCSAGMLVFGFKGERFRVGNQENCNYMYIRFEGSRAAELLRRFDITGDNRVFEGFSGVIPLWKDSLSRADRDCVDLAAESMLLYAFSRLPRQSSRLDPLIAGILEITEERFREPELSLAEIARSMNYNAKYLSHYFRKKMDVGYSAYLKTLRIRYAVTLLEQGITSVKNVALLSGFSDPLYFSTVFKSVLGVSPSEYRAVTDGD